MKHVDPEPHLRTMW